MTGLDDLSAQVARSLAIVADAVADDLEAAGISAETTRGVALTYRQSYLEQKATR